MTQLKYDQVEQFRRFTSVKEKNDYIYLLQKEKSIFDGMEALLYGKAEKLYKKCIRMPDSSLASRCCDFKLLEKKCDEYSRECRFSPENS